MNEPQDITVSFDFTAENADQLQTVARTLETFLVSLSEMSEINPRNYKITGSPVALSMRKH